MDPGRDRQRCVPRAEFAEGFVEEHRVDVVDPLGDVLALDVLEDERIMQNAVAMGHQECGAKKPISPAPSAISASPRSSGRASIRRAVNSR